MIGQWRTAWIAVYLEQVSHDVWADIERRCDAWIDKFNLELDCEWRCGARLHSDRVRYHLTSVNEIPSAEKVKSLLRFIPRHVVACIVLYMAASAGVITNGGLASVSNGAVRLTDH